MKKYVSLMLALSTVATTGAGVALAQEESVSVETTAAGETTAVKPRIEAIRARTEARVDALKAKVEDRAEAVKTRLDNRVEAVQVRAEKRVENVAERESKLKARAEKVKAERKAKLDDAKKARVEIAARNTMKMLSGALDRIKSLATRVEARITKIEATGTTVPEARVSIGEALALVEASRIEIANLETDMKAALDSETPIGTFEAFRTRASAIKDGLKSAHAKVVSTVTLLKGLSSVQSSAGATTTTTVTAQ